MALEASLPFSSTPASSSLIATGLFHRLDSAGGPKRTLILICFDNLPCLSENRSLQALCQPVSGAVHVIEAELQEHRGLHWQLQP